MGRKIALLLLPLVAEATFLQAGRKAPGAVLGHAEFDVNVEKMWKAYEASVENMTRTKDAQPPHASISECKDTPDWQNAYGFTCADYENRWCANGEANMGKAWALGAPFGHAERNCCACGREKHFREMYSFLDNLWSLFELRADYSDCGSAEEKDYTKLWDHVKSYCQDGSCLFDRSKCGSDKPGDCLKEQACENSESYDTSAQERAVAKFICKAWACPGDDTKSAGEAVANTVLSDAKGDIKKAEVGTSTQGRPDVKGDIKKAEVATSTQKEGAGKAAPAPTVADKKGAGESTEITQP